MKNIINLTFLFLLLSCGQNHQDEKSDTMTEPAKATPENEITVTEESRQPAEQPAASNDAPKKDESASANPEHYGNDKSQLNDTVSETPKNPVSNKPIEAPKNTADDKPNPRDKPKKVPQHYVNDKAQLSDTAAEAPRH